MAAGKGSSFLLKDNSTGTPATIGGLRSTSMTINGEAVDITTKDSNAFISSGNDKARDLLQGGGVRSMTLSASGVFTDSSTENILRGFAFDGAIQNYDLVFSDGSKIAGAFLITSYERAGEFNGEETYSVTLESSNTITYTNA
jgi:TP901-1 family phage major tail protein|tara:strand:+ start:2207 stop:2635 length:429 start_codon:yes stop_codon:yes gene_type:complete